MKAAFVAAILLAFTLCVYAADDPDVPKHLYYTWSFSAAGTSGSMDISLKNDTLTRESGNKIETATPSREQWRKFRKTLNEIGVWQWNARYGRRRTKAGAGYSWQLTLKYSKRALTSAGNTGAPKQLKQFEEALNALFIK